MISIGKLRSADYYEREVVDGAEDYYVRPGEAPGRWVGNLAAELGLQGTVDGDDLAALFELRHPHTGAPLLDTYATKPGFDLTISAPQVRLPRLGPGRPSHRPPGPAVALVRR